MIRKQNKTCISAAAVSQYLGGDPVLLSEQMLLVFISRDKFGIARDAKESGFLLTRVIYIS